MVPIPTLPCNSEFPVTFRSLKVDNPLVAFTLPVKLPITSPVKLERLNDPTVNVPVTSASPLISTLFPKKALLVTVEVPTTCKLWFGCVSPIPNDP